MKITKYEHACLVIEEQGKKLVIDPGVFNSSLPALDNVVGVVITHAHQDHLDKTQLDKIMSANPKATIFTVKSVAKDLGNSYTLQIVADGIKADAGPFFLEFFGHEHAIIHESIPVIDNVGVMVNDIFYYPGDSFTPPNRPVVVLALPSGAPWMSVGEAMDFLAEVKPTKAFPTHNAVLSEAGNGFHNGLLEAAAQQAGSTYEVLQPGQSIEV